MELKYLKIEQMFHKFPPTPPTNYEELIELFPSLLGNIWFECGLGWLDLIYNLCIKIAEIIGRDTLNIEASQVKEKYGGLCFYMSETIDEIDCLIEYAENRSLTICEVCGSQQGKLFNDGWYMVRCPDCKAKEKF